MAYINRSPRGIEQVHYTKAALIEDISVLFGHLTTINTARDGWWKSKSALRANLIDAMKTEDQMVEVKAAHQEKGKAKLPTSREKMNQLQAINGRAVDMIREM